MKDGRNVKGPAAAMIIGVIITVVVLCTGVTLAYLIDRDDAVNEMTEGETVIEISETFPPLPEQPEPGEPVVKVVRITNTGNLTCTVRARLVFTDDGLRNITEPLEIGEDWILNPDGFYYYLLPLSPGEATKPLIERVVFRSNYADGTPVTAADIEKIDAGLSVYSEALEFICYPSGKPTAEEIIGNWGGY
ncbi:MAG: hypothetical protein J5950_03625 [Clostridia bacterium]|nr:hypothetical protein [Clostridia bacterium]